MPGTMIEMKVAPKQKIEEAQKLIVIETMKMEMALPSPLRGQVKDVHVKPGDRVDSGDLLVVFK